MVDARLTVLVCVAMCSTVMAQQVAPDCCMPDQASYTVHTENGTNYKASGIAVRESTFLKGTFDYQKNRISLRGLNTISQNGSFVVQNYWIVSTPTASIFIDEAGKHCYAMPVIWFNRFCIPGNATHLGTSEYGPPGKGFKADNYRFRLHGTSFFAAVDAGCTPINLVQSTETDVYSQMLSSAISNLSYIIDEADFTMPAWCNMSLPTSAPMPGTTASV